jgi:hypothetical protein
MRHLWTWMHQQMDSLSSLQLYAVIVGVTSVIAMTLLEAGGPPPPATTTTTLPSESNTNVASSAVSSSPNIHHHHHHHPTTTSWTNKASSISSKHRIKVAAEPQWYIFKWVNVVAVTLFLAVLVHLFVLVPSNNKGYHHHAAATTTSFDDSIVSSWSSSSPPLAQFLVAWSVFVCYCFGFFGVSLVYDSMHHPPPPAAAAAAVITPPKVPPPEEPSHPASSSSSLEPIEKIPQPTG